MEGKEQFVAEEEKKTQAEDFWNDPKQAQKTLKGIRSQKTWIEACAALCQAQDEVSVMSEFLEAGEAAETDVDEALDKFRKQVEELEFKKMLSEEEDRLGGMVTINSGAGGTESQDWAQMLMRM
ncbi:MAG: PCRF domain-containing protein, partial [Bacteroidales bacterium]|nr:PCRF domain-containing protein [Bacteroidales bacterium]